MSGEEKQIDRTRVIYCGVVYGTRGGSQRDDDVLPREVVKMLTRQHLEFNASEDGVIKSGGA